MIRIVSSCALLLGATLIMGAAPNQKQTWTGEIMDVQCSMLKSHQMMQKQIGAKDAVECTRACLERGGKAVLYDPAVQKVFQLDDQEKAKQYAGQRVEVLGSEAQDGLMLRVDNIKPLSK